MQRRFERVLMLIAVLATLAVLVPGQSEAAPGVRQAYVRQDEFGACGDPATPIHDLQGTDERTPVGGTQYTIEGVVTADMQDRSTQFGGFFMQEESADADTDPLTSEGIFVDSTVARVDVAVGDVVRVTGTAFELASDGANLTQLRRVKALVVCSSGAEVEPVAVTLPVAEVTDLEAFEGMLITFPQELTVTEVYTLARYGEVVMSADGRLFQPTEVAAPGEDALALEAANNRRRIILDDQNNQQNIDPTLFPAGGLSVQNTLRIGSVASGVTGVLDQRVGVYRVQVTQPVVFEPANPRAAEPPDVGGRLRVASFNVLNYFNGDGLGGGFPTERGADTPEEFERQRAKIISAILALDADVVGLIEIENDGDGPESAIADLVNGLNEAAGEELYAYVPDAEGLPADIPNSEEGGDAIKQAIIYQPGTVTPVGDPVLTVEPPFDAQRPPAVQAFEENATGERFVVAINHFKSKSCTDAGVDPDLGDGQGCWNQMRVNSALALVEWLASDPTGAGDADALLLGDLNSYAAEDPIRALVETGYTRLPPLFGDDQDYSYVYGGQFGTLDQALASKSLLPQVTGAAYWHINSDEPPALDYNVEYKSENHAVTLYAPDPFRSSDHDPVLVGLALGGEVVVEPTAEATSEATEEPTAEPTVEATEKPTTEPTAEATEEPTAEPTAEPTVEPTTEPTVEPTVEATAAATSIPVEPGDGDDGESKNDDTPGLIAIIAGVAAVLVAMLLGVLGMRRKK